MWCVCSTEYYSAKKKNEILPFVATWMDLEDVMLRKSLFLSLRTYNPSTNPAGSTL